MNAIPNNDEPDIVGGGLNRPEKREHNRLVAGLRNKRQSGAIVTQVNPDGSISFYQVKKFTLDLLNK